MLSSASPYGVGVPEDRHVRPTLQPCFSRHLPQQPSLEQLKKQAKELLERFRGSESTAVVEVRQFERNADPCHFARNDAQRVLARADGFPSWPMR